MGETLFTRLSSYSQNPAKRSLENFTTEVLVHLINNDKVFRKVFIHHIIRAKDISAKDIQKSFQRASAESQQNFGNGIVDIVLTSGNKRILIEIKIAAAETETKIYGQGWKSQIQKYLDYKIPVAYLTTKAIGAPFSSKKTQPHFLGQSYFEDLHKKLIKVSRKLTESGDLFLKFMEENDMKSPEPFTKDDLKIAERAFNFAKKCENLLDEIKPELESNFRSLFKNRSRFTNRFFSPTYGEAYIYVRGGTSSLSKIRWLGVSFKPKNNKLFFDIWIGILKTDIEKLNKRLKWKKEGSYLYTSHSVEINTSTEKYVKFIKNDLASLERALKQAY